MLLTDDEIKAIIEPAFKPFACVVESRPNRTMRFRVIKGRTQTPIYIEPGIPIDVLREESDLRELLHSVRRLLQKRGYRLIPLEK